MLTHVPTATAIRMNEVRSYIAMISALPTPGRPVTGGTTRIPIAVTGEVQTLKGLFFVHLYGTYEATVTGVVQETIQILNGMNLRVADCKPELLSMVLHPQCESLVDVGRGKRWEKRYELFQRVNSLHPASIAADIMPTSGRNLVFNELQSIWWAFGLTGNVLPHPRLAQRISEVVEKRNAIAHGTETAGQVGSRYTVADMTVVFNDIDQVCTHLTQAFIKYLNNGDYRA